MGNGAQGRQSPLGSLTPGADSFSPWPRRKELGWQEAKAEMTAGDTPTCLQGRSLCSLPGPGPTRRPAPGAVPMARGAENFSTGHQPPSGPSAPHPWAPYA